MKLSVIIPTFNRRALIEQTLPTVLDQTYPADEYEVIVVVDGSTDGTAAALQRMSSSVRLIVIEQENRGQAAARNAGLRIASGELVLFLDDDLFCGRTLVAEHIAAHPDDNSLVFGPILVSPQSPETLATKWMRSITQEWLSRLEREGVRWPDDAVMANSSLRRDILITLGGFDEIFFRALEDVELGRRLWKTGLGFKYCPTLLTYQLYMKSTDDVVLHDTPLYGTKEVLLCRKHPEFFRHSSLSSFTKGGWLKRKVLELCVRSPFPLDPLLKLAERVSCINPALELRVFKTRKGVSYFCSLVSCAGGWTQFERDYVRVFPVLMYHHVGPLQMGAYPKITISPDKFREQMEWLKLNGYTTIRTVDWLAFYLEGKPLPPKPVMLTFDDAYEDLIEYAFPLLKKNGYTASVFVVTGEVGGHNSWDLKNGYASLRCMSEDQIRRWAGLGIEFGAHSRTHADLTMLSNSELEQEIAGSGRDLAEILGTAPLSFAYPYGYYNDAVRVRAENSYKLAFTCDKGLNGLGTEPHMLRRTMVRPGDSLLEFGLRVKFGGFPFDDSLARVQSWNLLK